MTCKIILFCVIRRRFSNITLFVWPLFRFQTIRKISASKGGGLGWRELDRHCAAPSDFEHHGNSQHMFAGLLGFEGCR